MLLLYVKPGRLSPLGPGPVLCPRHTTSPLERGVRVTLGDPHALLSERRHQGRGVIGLAFGAGSGFDSPFPRFPLVAQLGRALAAEQAMLWPV